MQKTVRFHLFILILLLCSVWTATVTAQQWTSITAGGEFSLAVKSDGTLWGCGYNGDGQLGTGDTDVRTTLTQLNSESGWTAVEAGGFHALALKEDGTIWAFGLNAAGQLGQGDNEKYLSPVQVGSEDDWIAVEAGYATSYALKRDGTLWAWGYNPYGQIGNGETGHISVPDTVAGDLRWRVVSAGGVHVLGITRDGDLYSWGGGPNGQLGLGDTRQFSYVPALVDSTRDWIWIAAGFEFSLGVTADGKLWSWGFNGNGQLGHGDYVERKVPTEVTVVDVNWKRVYAGSSFVFGINQDDALFAWGANIHGQLGFNDAAERRIPEKVPSDASWSVVAPAEGLIFNQMVFGHHVLALHEERTAICVAGANYGHQIGLPGMDPSVVFNCSVGDLTTAMEQPDAVAERFDVFVYPNPAHDLLHLQVYSSYPGALEAMGRQRPSTSITVDLFDMLGRSRPVPSTRQGEEMQLDISSLPRGNYFLRVSDPTGAVRMKRIALN